MASIEASGENQVFLDTFATLFYVAFVEILYPRINYTSQGQQV